jgi:hypothetical protein
MRSLSIILTACVAGGCASYEVDGVAALSVVQPDAPEDVTPFFDDEAGVRLAGNLSRSLITPGFVRGEGGNGLRGNINFSAATYQGNGDSELLIVSPQVGPSFRLSFAGIFAEAGATAGGAWAELSAGGDEDDEISWAARPYLRAGLVSDSFLLGIEGGYELTGLDFGFGQGGEDYENWYVGVLVGLRLSQ